MKSTKRQILCGATLATFWAPIASAQITQSPSVEPQTTSVAAPAETSDGDIIVTAQKRSQSLQRVPLSIIAIPAVQLAEQKIETVSDLQRLVPNFTAQRGASVSNLRLNIRGIGAAGNTSVDQSVAVFLDGVYVARPSAVYASFLDIDAVEIVRGPQGTLFGRNTTAGGIILHSADPDRSTSMTGYAEGGNFDRYKAQIISNALLSDRFRVRAALQTAGSDGFGRNLVTNAKIGRQRSVTGRLGLGIDVTSSLTWTGKVDFARITGDGQIATEAIGTTISGMQLAAFATRLGGTQNLPELDNPTDLKVRQITGGDLKDRQYGGSSRFVLDVNGWEARLISGYRNYKNSQFDAETLYVARPFLARNTFLNSESSSQELQIASPTDQLLSGRLNFVTGLYYYQEDLGIGEAFDIDPNFCTTFTTGTAQAACLAGRLTAATDLQFQQSGESIAVYGQAEFRIAPTLTVQVGARYTWDDKKGRFTQLTFNPVGPSIRAPEANQLTFDDKRPTYRAALTWDAADDVHLFASYSTGYKAGGFNAGGGSTALGAARRTFASESAKNYEFGLRTRFADRRVTLNATLYRIDLGNLQDRSFDGSSFVVRNAGSLRHQGIETEARVAVGSNLTVAGSLSYLDSKFLDFRNASALPGCSAASPAIVGCGPVGGIRTVQDLTGKRAHYAPDWQSALNATYSRELGRWGLILSGGMTYVGDQFVGSVTDNNPQTIQKAYALVNARLAVTPPGERLEVALFGENLSGKGYCANEVYQPSDALFGVRNPATGGTLVRCFAGAPRTYGVSLKATF